MKKYEVRPGDTLSAIALREYGDSGLYPAIARQNHLADPDRINVGQQLLLPYITRRHLVAEADSTALRKELTQRYYGTQDTDVQLIWEVVNGVAQRPIQQGAWLLLPELGDVGHHTVVAGETLGVLAARWYGDEHLALILELANHLPTGTEPAPGKVLVQPGLNRRRAVAGDTLRTLCRDEYGPADTDTRVAVAAAANYLANPDTLFSRQVIHFPS
ncbi:LysM peptidoglycan-binding domain-containing protein [Nocardia blacklockiae]|uniref:LysM peptidoglycan-binding domain-containing protein n=1 Tax=Nocardia blacklockiae TaxID=480036 RepID=UPI0018954AB9|nr:LysM peptidoglycan-binding domain-containing protein [Nocardia blacklockiae]MBF6175784.1 LysM peptidoglycan-binding domain-containing protein [Nocardia blacklockiae]